MQNFLSIDVEDWYHLLVESPETWDSYESRVSIGVHKILEILDRYDTKATFFVLGYVADREPDLVRKIHDRGHEIASHGYYHNYVHRQTPDEFEKDLKRSVHILENLTGKKIQGFRASSFSIDKRTWWTFEILDRTGILYDSSIMPAQTVYYGLENANRYPHKIDPQLNIVEVPPSVISVLGKRLPVLGGFPLRFFPDRWNDFIVRQHNRKGQRAHVYLHPWELDLEQPRMVLNRRWRFVRYHNMQKTESRFKNLLINHSFAPISQLIKNYSF
jgi:polysaccharide deacetylase family protein (PEP-CTERM system associated)